MINYVENDETLESVILDGMKSIRKTDQKGRMYASTSGFCERRTALEMTFIGDTITEPSTKGYFKLGIAIEEIVLDSLFEQGKLLFSQYDLPDIGLNLGGKIDGIYKLENQPIKLLEIKSCGNLPNKPYPENLAQSNLYSAILGLDIDLLYFSRNVADYPGNILMKKFENVNKKALEYDSVYKAVLGKICADMGYMPEKSSHIKSKLDCGFCKFKSICWNGDKSHLEPIPSAEIFSQILDLTEIKTNAILDKTAIEQRKNGVLKHLSQFGTDYAKNLLFGKNWDDLI